VLELFHSYVAVDSDIREWMQAFDNRARQ